MNEETEMKIKMKNYQRKWNENKIKKLMKKRK